MLNQNHTGGDAQSIIFSAVDTMSAFTMNFTGCFFDSRKCITTI